MDEKNLDYVLLGLINSDPLEGRFGWYRQLAGTNYYLSVWQFLEAEKKIRLKSLVKFAKLNMSEVANVFQSGKKSAEEQIEVAAANLLALLPSEVLGDSLQLDQAEGIVYYIAGYIARSILKRTRCDSCPCLLVVSREAPEISVQDEENEETVQAKEKFLRFVDRGGLVTPSELVACVYLGIEYMYTMF